MDEDIAWESELLLRQFVQTPRFQAVSSRFRVTHFEYFALLPHATRVDDVLYVLYGGAHAVMALCRALNVEGNYILVGPAYVHGFMNGEALSMCKEGFLEERDFNIV